MKAKWFAVALLVLAGHARAQVGELYDADSAGDGALYALALHRSPYASQRLYELALNTESMCCNGPIPLHELFVS